MVEQFGRADQRLGRYAAGIEAVATQLVALHKCDLCLYSRSDVASDQTGRAAADNDHVTIIVRGFFVCPSRINFSGANAIDNFLGNDGQKSDQDERADQARR